MANLTLFHLYLPFVAVHQSQYLRNTAPSTESSSNPHMRGWIMTMTVVADRISRGFSEKLNSHVRLQSDLPENVLLSF